MLETETQVIVFAQLLLPRLADCVQNGSVPSYSKHKDTFLGSSSASRLTGQGMLIPSVSLSPHRRVITQVESCIGFWG